MTEDLRQAARSVPPPVTISQAARRQLEGMSRPEVVFPALTDLEGWRRHVEDVHAYIAQQFAATGQSEPDAGDRRVIAGSTCYVAEPAERVRAAPATIMDIHGGAFLYMGGRHVGVGAATMARRFGLTVVSVDYRTPPDDPWPAGLDDCLSVYEALLTERGAKNLVVHGSSAGGNLAAAMLMRARARELPMPAGLCLMSPAMDLTESGDTFRTLDGLDVLTSLAPISMLYANGRPLDDASVSPLFGSFRHFPPTLLQSGTRDLFLSNTVLTHRAMRDAGVAAELHIWEAMPHAGFPGSEEDAALSREMHRFLNARFEHR